MQDFLRCLVDERDHLSGVLASIAVRRAYAIHVIRETNQKGHVGLEVGIVPLQVQYRYLVHVIQPASNVRPRAGKNPDSGFPKITNRKTFSCVTKRTTDIAAAASSARLIRAELLSPWYPSYIYSIAGGIE